MRHFGPRPGDPAEIGAELARELAHRGTRIGLRECLLVDRPSPRGGLPRRVPDGASIGAGRRLRFAGRLCVSPAASVSPSLGLAGGLGPPAAWSPPAALPAPRPSPRRRLRSSRPPALAGRLTALPLLRAFGLRRRRRGACASPPLSSSRIRLPSDTLSPFLSLTCGDAPRRGRRHVHRRLFGFDRDQRRFFVDLLAVLHQHVDHVSRP